MVSERPVVSLIHSYKNTASYSTEPEYIATTVIECTKGTPFVPMYVDDSFELLKEFKKEILPFEGCGGRGIWICRATAGTPVKAVAAIKDTTSGTALTALTLTAKQYGSYSIYYTVASLNGYNILTIEEEGYKTERYREPATDAGITALIAKIEATSQIVDVSVGVDSNGILATVSKSVLGSAVGDTDGSDGTTKVSPDYDGQLADADAPTAHETALSALENVLNPQPGIVFSTHPLAAVNAKYANHADEMNTDLSAKWRIVIVGADPEDDIDDRKAVAIAYNSENIWYVAQGCYGNDDILYEANEMTAAVAGALAATEYHEAIWGGADETVLQANGSAFFDDVAEIADEVLSYDDQTAMNEAGCITFEKDKYGVKVLETVTTAQTTVAETDEDEGSVVRIVQKAKRTIYDAASEMKGRKITETFGDDLTQKVGSALDDLVTDGALIDVDNEGLSAYEISASAIPRAKQILGIASISFILTVAHAARQIYGNMVVR